MPKMTAQLYDTAVANPWFGVQPLLQKNEKPLLLAFVQSPVPGFPNIVNAKNTFLMKTMCLLAEDLNENFMFAYVDLNTDEDWIGYTFKITESPQLLLI